MAQRRCSGTPRKDTGPSVIGGHSRHSTRGSARSTPSLSIWMRRAPPRDARWRVEREASEAITSPVSTRRTLVDAWMPASVCCCYSTSRQRREEFSVPILTPYLRETACHSGCGRSATSRCGTWSVREALRFPPLERVLVSARPCRHADQCFQWALGSPCGAWLVGTRHHPQQAPGYGTRVADDVLQLFSSGSSPGLSRSRLDTAGIEATHTKVRHLPLACPPAAPV